MELLCDAFPGQAAFELAVTHALLEEVGAGRRPPALRIFRPAPTVALGRLDALRPGYEAARAAARRHGFEPVLRLGGGHAAAFDEGSLVIDEITPQPAIAQGLRGRFERVTGTLATVLAGVAPDVRTGELPGEYCAGSWSVNAGGRIKLAGTAQRAVRGAALVTAVVVVHGGARIRNVLVDVYDALELEWDPATAGALDDVAPQAGIDEVERRIVAAWDSGLQPATLQPGTLARARELEPRHLLPT